MIPLLFNRASSGAIWIHIVPKGVLANKEAGIDQVLDDKALESIKSDLEAEKSRLGNAWPGLYFGEEHHIYDAGKSSAALGWAKKFEIRADGLWAEVEPTDIGESAIQNKRFKFTSFAASPSDLEALGGKKYRVLRVDTVGLTNMPNGKELLKPITNRGADSDALAKTEKIRALCKRGMDFMDAYDRVEAGETVNNRRGTGALLANRIQRETGSSFADAAIAAAKYESASTAEQRRMALLNRRVNRLKAETNCGFERAWNVVVNRLSQAAEPYNLRPEEIDQANRNADSVFSEIQAEYNERANPNPDRGRFNTDWNLASGAFIVALRMKMEDEGLSLREAYDDLRQTEPILWTRGVNLFDRKEPSWGWGGVPLK